MSTEYYQAQLTLTVITKDHPLFLKNMTEYDMNNSHNFVVSNEASWKVITKEEGNKRIEEAKLGSNRLK